MAEESQVHDHTRPSRCCEDESPEAVLARLLASPPVRMGYRTRQGWSGESDAAFQRRMDAWRAAVLREETARSVGTFRAYTRAKFRES